MYHSNERDVYQEISGVGVAVADCALHCQINTPISMLNIYLIIIGIFAMVVKSKCYLLLQYCSRVKIQIAKKLLRISDDNAENYQS